MKAKVEWTEGWSPRVAELTFSTCKLHVSIQWAANLEGTTFFLTEFDDQTNWPANFPWPTKMQLNWMSKGPAPRDAVIL